MCWWAQMESNHRPHAYQACALTGWAIGPCRVSMDFASKSNHLRVICFECILYIQKWTVQVLYRPIGIYSAFLHISVLYTFWYFRGQIEFLFIPPRTLVRKGEKNSIWTENLLRKEVIQPHLPIRLPCYDFTPIIDPTFDCCLLAVSSQASGVIDSHGVTGGVYKARERIHRDILIRDY